MERIRINKLESELNGGNMLHIIHCFLAMRFSPSYFVLSINHTINIPSKDHAEKLVFQQVKSTPCETIRMRSIHASKEFLAKFDVGHAVLL